MNKITLHGFNNLTKNLSFSLYKLHYLHDKQTHCDYNAYINKQFCANTLTRLLTNICHEIGGNVLNIAKQDYQPQGASVTLMISEETAPPTEKLIVAHLDKSHICIHTYPDDAPQAGIAIFRADIELSTCGVISPLKVLDYVISAFDADVIDIDFRIRGMTRNKQGKKLFNIDGIEKISAFFNQDTVNKFILTEHNFSAQNLFHTNLTRKNVNLTNHVFEMCPSELTDDKQLAVHRQLTKEMQQLSINAN